MSTYIKLSLLQMGEGSGYFIERMTRSSGATPPGKPSFIWQHVTTKKGEAAIKVTWIPNTESNPGSHFFVKYKYVSVHILELGSGKAYNNECNYYYRDGVSHYNKAVLFKVGMSNLKDRKASVLTEKLNLCLCCTFNM